MLLISNSLIICQTINTENIKCFQAETVNEIFKGLKQGEYLKKRLDKTEISLDNANALLKEQKSAIAKRDNLIEVKEGIINNLQTVVEQTEIASKAKISQVETDLKILQKQAKKDGRKKFWSGIKWGTGGTIAVAGIITGILIFR